MRCTSDVVAVFVYKLFICRCYSNENNTRMSLIDLLFKLNEKADA